MRFGVNYTPSQGWFHSWLDLDHAAIARDFAQIAGLGLDHVRIFPLWPIVQPNRALVRSAALREIREVVDLAGEAGLDVEVDAIQGHLSSFDFLPSWLATWHDRNMFTSPDVVGSLADYVRAVSSSVADAPNLLGVSVGNEVNQFAARPHPHPHEAAPAQVTHWLDAMIGAAREGLGGAAPAAGVTHSMYDASWYDDRQPFLPDHAAELGDLTVTHSWVFNGAAQRHGPLGSGSVRHAEYLLRLSAAWHRDPDRRLWLQEVGAPTNVVPVDDAPEFVERTVRNAATVPGLWGITWWCSHDVAGSLADFPPLEYDLGLLTSDGEVKPTGRRFAELAERRDELVPTTGPGPALVLDDSDPATYRAQLGPGGSFFEAWNAAASETGTGPRVVLRSRLAEGLDLDARGIVELRPVAVAAPEPIDVLHPAVTPTPAL
ncbi:MAG: glycosyl hydrolase [Micrococcales bacterium 73-15]|uniref:glycoside hydrolase 5 family protein n=1 Tax=Salana multivorans TaxID=120377 RepID=UPI00096796C1|nr:glycosyl hydrolase [Salana multivorans]OJX97469.1 MAG: glycosyl hydrolase [Micrococcales bacterium 73-15]